MTNPIHVPRKFFDDHADRDLPTPTPVAECSKYYDVDRNDPALPELLNDAEYYAESVDYVDENDPTDVDTDMRDLVMSARETVKAIKGA